MVEFEWLFLVLQWMAIAFSVVVGGMVFLILVLFLYDLSQTKHSLRRNYPLIGRFRYVFEKLGEFFRQYMFAMEREELPFNRAQRSWAYRAAKNIDTTLAFGSTKPANFSNSVTFLNAPFPRLDSENKKNAEIVFGPDTSYPYQPNSFFNISGMSYGSISKPAIRALSYGAQKAGCWLNTGEGGLSSYHLESGCDIVFQIGTAKYGVRDAQGNLSEQQLSVLASHPQIKMFEIKLSQGAKPGKGGILPGKKVTPEVSLIRGIPVGQDSISPNRHLDVESAQDLLNLIARVRLITGRPVGIKFVLGVNWLEDFFQTVHTNGIESAPDFITLDGAEGGTGAAPMSLMDDMGLFLYESLPVLIQALHKYDLRDRIRIIVSGKMITPERVAWALAAGADVIQSARGFMFALGCIQSLQCNKDTCPTGITTHNLRLQRGLVVSEKSLRVMHYHNNMVKEVMTIAHACGVTSPHELNTVHFKMVNI
ncbi:MAG: FMN-binding glutamate synthase family protein [Pseudomonadota bacterium]